MKNETAVFVWLFCLAGGVLCWGIYPWLTFLVVLSCVGGLVSLAACKWLDGKL